MKKMKERLERLGLSLLAVIVALIPTWLFLLFRYLMSPEGFWQNFATGALGLILLGGIQFLLIWVLLAILVAIWSK